MNTKKQIFILAGQSNMSGCYGITKGVGWDRIVPDPCGPHPSILRFMADSLWVPAQEPLHVDIDTSKTCGVGPGMAFANAIIRSSKVFDDVIVGLVPCAVGSMAIREWGKGMRLYEEMVRREAVEGGEGGGVVWFQGESDTLSEDLVDVYRESMERFIGDVRRDFDLSCLPFIQDYLSRARN